MRVATVVCGVLLTGGAWTAATPRAQDVGTGIVGVWVLNEDLSDKLAARVAGDESPAPRDSAGDGGFGFGGPGFGRYRRREPGGDADADRPHLDDPARRARAVQELLSVPREITIVETPRAIIVTSNDGGVVRLIPDDRAHAGIAGDGMEVRRTTTWVNHRLVTEIRLQSRTGFTLRKSYAARAGADRRQLVVTTRTADAPRETRTVYDLKTVVRGTG